MEYTIDMIDIDKLRESIYDYYESAFFIGIGPALSDLTFVKTLSDEALFEYAKIRFDLSGFIKGKVK
ncbi:MAG: hypothetical protein K5666_03940 [Bacilli bacterium]|nr:hypothetical protein [Bacilli bacterium]